MMNIKNKMRKKSTCWQKRSRMMKSLLGFRGMAMAKLSWEMQYSYRMEFVEELAFSSFDRQTVIFLTVISYNPSALDFEA